MRIEKCIFFARIRQFFCHENKLIIEKGPEKAFIPNIERLRISVEKEQSFKDIHHASACNFGDAIARMCSTGDAQALVVLFCFVLPFILLYLIILWCYNLNGLKILQNIFNSDHGLVFFSGRSRENGRWYVWLKESLQLFGYHCLYGKGWLECSLIFRTERLGEGERRVKARKVAISCGKFIFLFFLRKIKVYYYYSTMLSFIFIWQFKM